MSPRRTAAGSNPRTVAVSVVLVVVVAVALMLLVRARPAPGPFDPRSSRADGLRGLVLLLERYGATVHVAAELPAPGDGGRVLVARDSLDEGQRAALVRFVAAGGVAVVADPGSPFQRSADGDPGAPAIASVTSDHAGELDPDQPTVFQASVDAGTCTIDALRHLRGLAIERPTAFPVATGQASCFGDGRTALVRVVPAGGAADGGDPDDPAAGALVAIGDNTFLTNRWIKLGDDAGLAVALLAPEDGTVVTIVEGRGQPVAPLPDRSGDAGLLDLVRPSVWMGLVQLAVAFVVLTIALGVRPGRVVDEPVPSPLEGSALVAATGDLMQRAGHAARAGQLLRDDVHRRLCALVGAPPGTAPGELDAAIAGRGLAAPGAVLAALTSPLPSSPAALAELAAALAPVAALADARTVPFAGAPPGRSGPPDRPARPDHPDHPDHPGRPDGIDRPAPPDHPDRSIPSART